MSLKTVYNLYMNSEHILYQFLNLNIFFLFRNSEDRRNFISAGAAAGTIILSHDNNLNNDYHDHYLMIMKNMK